MRDEEKSKEQLIGELVELRRRNYSLETTLEYTHMLVAYLDPQFNFIKVNRAYAEADEREPSFFPGKNHFDLYPNAENAEIFRNVVETGKPYFAYAKPFEYIEHPERGVSYWDWSLVPITEPEGTVTGLVFTLVDVTERERLEAARRESEKALREQEELLRTIIKSTNDGMIAIDKNGSVFLFNPAAEAMFGYRQSEIIGQNLDRLIPEEYREIHRRYVKNYFDTGEPNRATHQLLKLSARRRDGSEFPMEISLATGRRGKEPFVIAIARDITDREQAEERARKLQRRVEEQQKLAVVGQLAAGIAHDFNNILTGMMGRAEMLSLMPGVPKSYQDDAHAILQEGRRAANLVQQILDFSSKSIIRKQPLELLPFLDKIVKRLQRTIPENIEIQLDSTPGTHIADADPAQIQQVVMNLAVNARDAMPGGGRLHIQLSDLSLSPGVTPPLPEIPDGDWIVLSVSDTGAGMPPEILAHIYEPFFTTKEVGEGSGLGLSQVYGIVRQHQGFIDVTSKVGQGTTFVIYLPALRVDAKPTGELKSSHLPRGQGECILLAEDNPMVLDVLQRLLDALGYEVLTARNGREALKIYEETRKEIALVLTDMVMPQVGGLELYQMLRRRDPSVKVILISGYPLGDEMEFLRSARITGWIQKPPSLQQLAEVVRRAIDS